MKLIESRELVSCTRRANQDQNMNLRMNKIGGYWTTRNCDCE